MVFGGNPEGLTLNRERLTSLLEAFGEYPTKYRRAVWWVGRELTVGCTTFRV